MTYNYLNISPNPSSGVIEIRFMINDSGSMQQELRNSNFELRKNRLEVYDVTGRLVKSFNLESCILDRGSTIIWDGTDQANRQSGGGVYFVRLSVGEDVVTRKIALIR